MVHCNTRAGVHVESLFQKQIFAYAMEIKPFKGLVGIIWTFTVRGQNL